MIDPTVNSPRRHPLVAWAILIGLLLALAAAVAVLSISLGEARRIVEPYILPDAGSTTGDAFELPNWQPRP